MATPDDNSKRDDQLSQLLKLKRYEQPDDAFWESFDQKLRSRQLSALVRTQSWSRRAIKLVSIVARKSAPTVATASAFALAFFALANTDLLVETPTSSAPMEEAAGANPAQPPRFVVESAAGPAEPIEADEIAVQPNQVYTVQALTRAHSNERYQLLARPKSFTAPQDASETRSFGAKVIRTDRQF